MYIFHIIIIISALKYAGIWVNHFQVNDLEAFQDLKSTEKT